MRQRPLSSRIASSTGQPETLSFMLRPQYEICNSPTILCFLHKIYRLRHDPAIANHEPGKIVSNGTGAFLRRSPWLFLRLDRGAGMAGPALSPEPDRHAGQPCPLRQGEPIPGNPDAAAGGWRDAERELRHPAASGGPRPRPQAGLSPGH